jgi:hypothetical protein
MSEFLYEVFDLDFFCVDDAGNIAHFASAGGRLPNHLIQNRSLNDEIRDYILSLPVKGVKSGSGTDSFKSFAEKGLFSYDKKNVTNGLDSEYRLMYTPMQPINYENLPTKFTAYLKHFRVSEIFGKEIIDIGALLLS